MSRSALTMRLLRLGLFLLPFSVAEGDLQQAQRLLHLGGRLLREVLRDLFARGESAGRPLDAATGAVFLELEQRGRLDGERLVVGDRPTDGTIDADGTLRNGSDHALRVELDGRVHGTHPDAPELRVEPITAETRRTAMLVVALGLLVRSDGSVSIGAAARP